MTELKLRAPTANIATRAVVECPCCGEDQARAQPLFEVKEHEYTTTTTDRFPLVECGGCTSWYLNPRPNESALDIIYPPNYYAYVMDGKQESSAPGPYQPPAKSTFYSNLAGKLFKARIKPIERHIGLSDKTRLLDIGCGSGVMLGKLQEIYGIKGVGVDLSEEAVANCKRKGFEAYCTRFEEFEPLAGTGPQELFDIVHSSHLIEHLGSPREYMLKVHSLLKPGGVCVFATPNKATWEAGWLRGDWGGLHAPRHWALLDGQSAESLCRSTGFQNIEIVYSTNGIFWVWSLHSWLS
ncbi:MAG TPA: class I SAM-dependent methyltransferase, partial [Chroococcales cyanobacterium]